jgi:hypothetical protein
VGTYLSAKTRTIQRLSLLALRGEAGNPYPATTTCLVWLYLLLLASIPMASFAFSCRELHTYESIEMRGLRVPAITVTEINAIVDRVSSVYTLLGAYSIDMISTTGRFAV